VTLRIAALAALVALGSCASGAAGAAEHSVRRVVSLIPSLTEDLFAVGAGDRVVGVSAYSDYPPRAKNAAGRVVVRRGRCRTDRGAAPDVVVAIPSQQGPGPRYHARRNPAGTLFATIRSPDVYANLHGIGVLVGRARQADALIVRLRARTAALTRARPRRARRPAVFVVLGTAPIFTVGRGSYIASLLELAGARNAAGDVQAPYARLQRRGAGGAPAGPR